MTLMACCVFNTVLACSVYYVLQTSAVSLTTEPVTTHENVLLASLVKTARIVGLGTHRTYLEILSVVPASVSNNNRSGYTRDLFREDPNSDSSICK